MKKINSIIPLIIMTFVLLAFPATELHSQDIDPTLLSLRGISKIGVIVEKINQPLHDVGINEMEIKNLVKDELISASITVLPMVKIHDIPGSPYLYINIGAIKSKQQDLYAVSLNVQLKQDVILSRNLKLKYYGATTWSTSNIGIMSSDKLKEINNFTKVLVDKFVKDFLIANRGGHKL